MMRYITLLLSAFGLIVPVQAGPMAPPCSGCPEHEYPTLPQTGHWIDQARPGTGFDFDIQDRILLGMYYGYREDGSAVWYVFSGELQGAVDDPDIYWTLEAGMLEMAGGQVLGQPYQAPQLVAELTIELRFSSRGLMRYRVDGGPEYGALPFVFGSELRQPFAEYSDVRLPVFRAAGSPPDLSGETVPWVITVYRPDYPPEMDYQVAASESVVVGMLSAPEDDSQSAYEIRMLAANGIGGEMESVGELVCDTPEALIARIPNLSPAISGVDPVCVAWWQHDFDYFPSIPPLSPRHYFFPVTDLTDRRFRGVSEDDGWVMEGFRLEYD